MADHMKIAVLSLSSIILLAGCNYSMEESLARSRLEIIDPTPDGDYSDAYFRDLLTGETCHTRELGHIGCGDA